jgi:hypothetical protein
MFFCQSTGRVLVSVGREDDVKFVGLCQARGIPVLRIGDRWFGFVGRWLGCSPRDSGRGILVAH